MTHGTHMSVGPIIFFLCEWLPHIFKILMLHKRHVNAAWYEDQVNIVTCAPCQ